MKILDTLERIGEACKNTTLSKEYDITLKLNDGKEEPRVIFRAAGTDAYKAVKFAASVAIVAGGAIIANQLKKGR